MRACHVAAVCIFQYNVLQMQLSFCLSRCRPAGWEAGAVTSAIYVCVYMVITVRWKDSFHWLPINPMVLFPEGFKFGIK